MLLLRERKSEVIKSEEVEGGTMYPETETVRLGEEGLNAMGWEVTMAMRLLLLLVPFNESSSTPSSSSLGTTTPTSNSTSKGNSPVIPSKTFGADACASRSS